MDLRNGFDLKRYIRTIPNYPKPGIQFRDITTLLSDLYGFKACVDELSWPFLKAHVDFVAGIEARGFILGGAIAHQLGRGFLPIRKQGKLPGKVVGQDYTLEYGADRIEIHADVLEPGHRVLLVDDLIATGGTAQAACNLIIQSGAEVVAAAFVINLPDLGGVLKLKNKGIKVHTLVSFEGE